MVQAQGDGIPGAWCPRCWLDLDAIADGAAVRWGCPRHGAVPPLWPVQEPTPELLGVAATTADVPVWLPWPLPSGWSVTGVATAGADPTAARAVALAAGGPAPLGGWGDLVVVAEEPGLGLGAGLAGLDATDAGTGMLQRPPDARVQCGGHPLPLWSLASETDRAVFVGEAEGVWLWCILWPADAGYLVAEDLVLADLRDHPEPLLPPVGALSDRLRRAPGGGRAAP